MKNLMIFESFKVYEAEKGLMHKLLDIPSDKKVTTKYSSGKKLAHDLLLAVKNSKIVPSKDVRKKATSMLAFAANWPSDGKNSVLDQALKSIKSTEVEGVPFSD